MQITTMKRQVTDWKIFASHKRRLVSGIYKEFSKLNRKTINPIKKWAKDLNTSPKKIYR